MFALLLAACSSPPPPPFPDWPGTPTAIHAAKELVVHELEEGTGDVAESGDRVTVHYTGWLPNGTLFDSSVGKAPFRAYLGRREVIPGWDQGVQGMKVGGKRGLVIPSELGYGERGAGSIPPNSPLVFELRLLKVQKPTVKVK